MKRILLCLMVVGLACPVVHAQDQDNDRNNDRSSALTPNAPRKVTLANPQKPAWLAEPHGK